MPDSAQGKILDAFAALYGGYAPLDDITVITDRSPDEAITGEELPCIVIGCEGWRFDPDMEPGSTFHTMILNFDFLETSANVGIVSRRAQEVIAYMLAAIGTDPTLGGRLEDIQEIDVAPPMDNGKSVGGSSLQCICTFRTPRRDHFTIIGVGGAEF